MGEVGLTGWRRLATPSSEGSPLSQFNLRVPASYFQAVILYPNRSSEQTDTQPYSDLLNGPRVHRIYLNELGDLPTLSPEIALMVLSTLDGSSILAQARTLVTGTQLIIDLAAIDRLETLQQWLQNHRDHGG